MRVFLAYASEDRATAEQIHLALTGAGHKVFFDREDLPPAREYHSRIRNAVRKSDAFVFLLSPESVDQGSYTLTELKHAQDRWPHPSGRVLPVLVRGRPWEEIPAYLKAVTVLEPSGNVPAEVLAGVESLEAGSARQEDESARRRPRSKGRRFLLWSVVVLVTTVVGVLILNYFKPRIHTEFVSSPTSCQWNVSIDGPTELKNVHIMAFVFPRDDGPDMTLTDGTHASTGLADCETTMTDEDDMKKMDIRCDLVKPSDLISIYFSWTLDSPTDVRPYDLARLHVRAEGLDQNEHFYR